MNSRSSEACCKLRHPVTFLKFTKRHALTYCRKFRRTSFAGSSSCRRSLPRRRPPVQLAPPAAAGRCGRRLSAAAGQPAEAAAADLAAAPPAKVTAYCGCKVTHTHTHTHTHTMTVTVTELLALPAKTPHTMRCRFYVYVGRPPVRPSVCLSMGPQQQTRCCLADKRYRLTAALLANEGSATLSAYVGS